jgi:hypothetical protein
MYACIYVSFIEVIVSSAKYAQNMLVFTDFELQK